MIVAIPTRRRSIREASFAFRGQRNPIRQAGRRETKPTNWARKRSSDFWAVDPRFTVFWAVANQNLSEFTFQAARLSLPALERENPEKLERLKESFPEEYALLVEKIQERAAMPQRERKRFETLELAADYARRGEALPDLLKLKLSRL